MSGRLNLTGALNRQSVFEDLPKEAGTHSASLARLERALKEVKDENGKLRNELQETRSTLEMMLKQKTHESFDERRVNLIKCQLIQQERQILLLNEALGSRSETLIEVENTLSWLADKFRSHIAEDCRSASVPVLRADLSRMVETVESARIKLFKNVENSSGERLSKPLMFMNDFLRPDLQKDCTLFDVVSGKLEHLNLKHVSHLESKLSCLYKELIRLHGMLSASDGGLCSEHKMAIIRQRLSTQLLRSCAMMRGCSDDLLSLSLLLPSASWPPMKRPVLRDVSVDDVLSRLPPLPRSKSQDVQRLVSAVLKVCSYRRYMKDKELQALQDEVKFHQTVYQLQVDYVHSLLDAVRDGYSDFEKSVREIIIKPLSVVLASYVKLKATAGEDELRDFLSVFKNNEEQFTDAVERLSVNLQSDGKEKNEALTAFGEDFMQTLNKVVYEEQVKRDRAASERQELRQEQDRLDEELRELLCELDPEHRREKDGDGRDGEKVEEQQGGPSLGNKSLEQSNRPTDARQLRHNMKLDIRKSQSDVNLTQNENTDFTPEKNNNFENNKECNYPEDIESERRASSRTTDVLKGKSIKPTVVTVSSTNKPPVVTVSSTNKPPVVTVSSTNKHSYKPNLYVPNRTLKLRRSGSLSRLASGSSSPGCKLLGEDTKSQEGNQSKDSATTERNINRRKSDLSKVSMISAKKAPFK